MLKAVKGRAHVGRRLGFVPCTTPLFSHQKLLGFKSAFLHPYRKQGEMEFLSLAIVVVVVVVLLLLELNKKKRN